MENIIIPALSALVGCGSYIFGYTVGYKRAMKSVAIWRREGREHPDYRHLPEFKGKEDQGP